MRINHNIAALNTHRQLSNNTAAAGKSLEKLSSGLRINRAGDDAAGLAISEKMRSQIRGLEMAMKNSQDSISLIQTAEGAMNEVHSILQRMRELAVQAVNDTNTESDRKELQKEINQLTSEINRVGNTTEFNEQKLLDGNLANTLKVTSSNTSKITANAAGGTNATVALDGASYKAGDYTIEITSVANTRADYTVDLAYGQTTVTGDGAKVVFDGDSITVDKDDIFHTNDPEWTIEVVDAATGELRITSNDKTGEAYAADKTFFVGEEFDAYGLKFTITDLNGASDGDTIAFEVDKTATTSIGTKLTGWDSTPVADPATETAPVWKTDLTVGSAAAAGDYKLTFNTGDKVVTVELDGVIVDTVGITDAYDYHGIKFQIDDVKDLADGSSISFTVEDPGATLSAKLGSTTVVLDNKYTGGTITDDVQLAGLKISGTDIKAGTYTFTVTSDPDIVTGEDKSLTFQTGSNENQTMTLAVEDIRAAALGIVGTGAGFSKDANVTDGTDSNLVENALDITTSENAAKAITVLDKAIQTVSSERSKLGAVQNRLEHTINNLGTSAENLTAAESRIRDVDMAKEMMNFTKDNILTQAAQAMLAQANQQPQGVLQLLR